MIEWEDKFSVGISLIDEEHMKFIDIINTALSALEHNGHTEALDKIFDEMTEYSYTHFSTEEAYMKEFNFPGYQSHKNEHIDFTNKTIDAYYKVINGDYQIAKEILEYLKQWLVKHIQGTDRQYIDCFKENGLQ